MRVELTGDGKGILKKGPTPGICSSCEFEQRKHPKPPKHLVVQYHGGGFEPDLHQVCDEHLEEAKENKEKYHLEIHENYFVEDK